MDESPSFQTPAFIVEVDATKKLARHEGATRGPADKLRELTDVQMELAFAVVEKVAAQAATTLQTLQANTDSPTPSTMELEFGLSFNAELQAYVVKAAGEATLSIKLSWTAS